jgi:hypothetical protein
MICRPPQSREAIPLSSRFPCIAFSGPFSGLSGAFSALLGFCLVIFKEHKGEMASSCLHTHGLPAFSCNSPSLCWNREILNFRFVYFLYCPIDKESSKKILH